MDNTSLISQDQSPVFPSTKIPNTMNLKKTMLLIVVGILLGLGIALTIYFLILRKEDQEAVLSNTTTTTEQTSNEINPDSFEYNAYVEPNKEFSFQYPSLVIRINTEDIEETIPQAIKSKYNARVLFIGVIQDKSSILQVSANYYEFDSGQTLDYIYDDLISLSQKPNVILNITQETIGDSTIDSEADFTVDNIKYKSIEKILVYPHQDGVKKAYGISVVITESAYIKYHETARFIIDSAVLDVPNDLDNDVETNSEIVTNIFLAKFPVGQNAPTDGEGLAPTTSFFKNSDKICLVTDLKTPASGFIIEVFDQDTNEIITSSNNSSFQEGLSSGCNDITFGPGEFTLKVTWENQIINQIDFEVN